MITEVISCKISSNILKEI